MQAFDFSPLYRATVGFDRIADLMDRVLTAEVAQPSYPPYNIEKTAEDAYRISIAVAGFAPEELSVEVKDPKRPEYGTITMVFIRDAGAPGGLRLRGWVALDSQNNRTRIDLSNQRFNVPVADSAFRWTDPRPKQRGRV